MFPQAYDNQGAFTDYLQYTSMLLHMLVINRRMKTKEEKDNTLYYIFGAGLNVLLYFHLVRLSVKNKAG